MKRRFLMGAAIAALALTMLPVQANDPVSDLANMPKRYAPQTAGTRQNLRFVFGPYTVGPGVDRNQITVDLPIQTGFTTGVFPNLIDVTDGLEFTEQEAHIHHAHWFRVSNDSQYEYYSQGLSWVFGTGEERTGGSLRDRESSAEGWTYGIYNDGTTPNVLIFMIHNKTAAPLTGYITLDVEFTWGTRDAIKTATGKDIHPLRGVLTGTTQDAVAKVLNGSSKSGVLMREYTTGFSGTLIASASHMHPGGKWVYVTNLGPKGANGKFVCGDTSNPEAVTDIDADGIPGTTLFVSKKIDAIPEAFPYSEEYQMGGTQGGFRAPIHNKDVIKQYGVYDLDRSGVGAGGLPEALFRSDPLNASSPISYASKDGRTHAWYEAMSYTGLYSDTENKPAVEQITDASQCTAANFEPYSVPSLGFNYSSNIRETFPTRPDWGVSDTHCEVPGYTQACEPGSAPVYQAGPVVSEIHTANFQYVWGDQRLGAPFNFLPKLKLGSTVKLVNEDIVLGGVRHTFTSCPWPCNGPYVANYPLPDGLFDTGKLGNLDYIDGGLVGDDTLPVYDLVVDAAKFTAGAKYAYFCMIHPWMRGAFEVTS